MATFITPHCISAYVIYRNGVHSRYLLLRRCGAYLPGTWQMVTGGLNEDETAWQGALREIQEETGIIPNEVYTADTVESFYYKVMDKIILAPAFVTFVKEPMSIILSPTEHDAFEWLSFEDARARLVWAEQKRVITHVHENFVLKQPLDLYLIKD